MYCSKCGKKILDNSQFCNFCGEKVDSQRSDAKSIENENRQYGGDIIKCPNCGEILDAFCVKCPSCGYELRNSSGSKTIQNFKNELDEILRSKTGKIPTLGFFFNDKAKTKKVIEVIKNFNIPNTKEDILEFFILASSNISINKISNLDAKDYEKDLEYAWLSKMEQAYQKARVAFGNDKSFSEIEKIYNKKSIEVKRAKFIPTLIFMLCIGLLILELVILHCSVEHSVTSYKLNKMYQEIQVDINDGKYDEALIKANELRIGGNDTQAKMWDEKRKAIIDIINKKMEGK